MGIIFMSALTLLLQSEPAQSGKFVVTTKHMLAKAYGSNYLQTGAVMSPLQRSLERHSIASISRTTQSCFVMRLPKNSTSASYILCLARMVFWSTAWHLCNEG